MKALLALLIRDRRIARIDLADGSVGYLTDDTGVAPDGIVVEGETVYWTTMGTPIVNPDIPGEKGRDYSPRNGGVHGLKLDGSPRFDIVPSGGVTTGKQLASDGSGMLYWGDREGCKVSVLVQRASELDWSKFEGIKSLGITAGASAPEVIVEEIMDAFAAHYQLKVETVSAAMENEFFPLPRPLRNDAAAKALLRWAPWPITSLR